MEYVKSFKDKYISIQPMNDLLYKCESIGKMLNSMIDKSSIFCKK